MISIDVSNVNNKISKHLKSEQQTEEKCVNDYKENFIFSFFWNSINLLNLRINTLLSKQ